MLWHRAEALTCAPDGVAYYVQVFHWLAQKVNVSAYKVSPVDMVEVFLSRLPNHLSGMLWSFRMSHVQDDAIASFTFADAISWIEMAVQQYQKASVTLSLVGRCALPPPPHCQDCPLNGPAPVTAFTL